MHRITVQDLILKCKSGEDVEVMGWVKSRRCYGGILFLNLVDFSGNIQVVIRKDKLGQNAFEQATRIAVESSVKTKGLVSIFPKKSEKQIMCSSIDVIGDASLSFSPRPRSNFDLFSPKYSNLLLNKRHLFLRNEKLSAILKFRHIFLRALREWFQKEGCVEITAPILTQSLLYDDSTAFKLDFFGHQAFLTQCVAFYLEAAICTFEKVYSIGPSFRAESGTGKRHIAEYWHVKGEMAFASRSDLMRFTEDMIYYVACNVTEEASKELKTLDVRINPDYIKPPYPRISYDEVIKMLNSKGCPVEFGKSLSDEDQRVLSLGFETPFFVVGLPANAEAFPYVLDSADPRVTMTADLFAPEGYGELLGTAEKICDFAELDRRFKEKGKYSQIGRYEWYFELRNYGCVPHAGFGMGVERVIRWMLKLSHVRDAIPFPRMDGRRPYP